MLVWIALLGCVIRFGDPIESAVSAPLPEPVDFSDVEARGRMLLSTIDDFNREERLRAAMKLASRMKTQHPDAQIVVYHYLSTLIELEERAAPQDLGSDLMGTGLDVGLPTIEEEVLFVEEDLDVAEPVPVDLVAVRAEAAQLTVAGDLQGALSALEACRGAPCWAEVSELWAQTRDGYVSQQREAAAAMFLAAREDGDPQQQRAQLQLVEQLLSSLLEAHPDTPYTDAINRNVQLVRDAIAELEAE